MHRLIQIIVAILIGLGTSQSLAGAVSYCSDDPDLNRVIQHFDRVWLDRAERHAKAAGFVTRAVSDYEIAVWPDGSSPDQLLDWGENEIAQWGGSLAGTESTLNGAALRLIAPSGYPRACAKDAF